MINILSPEKCHSRSQ